MLAKILNGGRILYTVVPLLLLVAQLTRDKELGEAFMKIQGLRSDNIVPQATWQNLQSKTGSTPSTTMCNTTPFYSQSQAVCATEPDSKNRILGSKPKYTRETI